MTTFERPQNEDYMELRLADLRGQLPALPEAHLRLEYSREEIDRTLSRVTDNLADQKVFLDQVVKISCEYNELFHSIPTKSFHFEHGLLQTAGYFKYFSRELIHDSLKKINEQYRLPVQLVTLEEPSPEQQLYRLRIKSLTNEGFSLLTAEQVRDRFEMFVRPTVAKQPTKTIEEIARSLRGSHGLVVQFKDRQTLPLSHFRGEESIKKDWHDLLRPAINEIVTNFFKADTNKLAALKEEVKQAEDIFERHRPRLRHFQSLHDDYREGKKIIDQTLQLANSGQQPVLVKNEKYGYHLSIANQLILKIDEDNSLSYFSSPNKQSPFSIQRIPINSRLLLARRWCELMPGDLVTENGLKIIATQMQDAIKLFNSLEKNLIIFPSGDVDQVLATISKANEDAAPSLVQPRTWGQEMLHSANPDHVFQAKLFDNLAIGWQVFQFHDKYVVEADSTNHATYIVQGKAGLELIQKHSRTYLKRHHPEEFVDRVIHPGTNQADRDAWYQQVMEHLGK